MRMESLQHSLVLLWRAFENLLDFWSEIVDLTILHSLTTKIKIW